jgi:hypothetical protein
MSLKASVESLYLEIWTCRNTSVPNRGAIESLNPGVRLKPLDRHLPTKRLQTPSKPTRNDARSVRKACRMVFSRSNGTTVARTGIAVGVARDVGYRFAGDCNRSLSKVTLASSSAMILPSLASM